MLIAECNQFDRSCTVLYMHECSNVRGFGVTVVSVSKRSNVEYNCNMLESTWETGARENWSRPLRNIELGTWKYLIADIDSACMLAISLFYAHFDYSTLCMNVQHILHLCSPTHARSHCDCDARQQRNAIQCFFFCINGHGVVHCNVADDTRPRTSACHAYQNDILLDSTVIHVTDVHSAARLECNSGSILQYKIWYWLRLRHTKAGVCALLRSEISERTQF